MKSVTPIWRKFTSRTCTINYVASIATTFTKKRLAILTALVTGVGLIPLALGKGEPGKEIQQPLAVVILGGIFTSTFLNMIVIPALYLKFAYAEVTISSSPRNEATMFAD
jgi:Cu/Ag efflux pump CusA